VTDHPTLFELPPPPVKPDPDERYTPTKWFRPWHVEFRFTLDACATAESAKLPRFITAKENGLLFPWDRERVFCNPPYSDIEPWVVKAWSSDEDLVVMPLPNWTDRKWWARYVEPWRDRCELVRVPGLTPHSGYRFSTRFLDERICFGTPGDPEGFNSGRPEFASVLLIWEHA
jgi:hypothetical protein